MCRRAWCFRRAPRTNRSLSCSFFGPRTNNRNWSPHPPSVICAFVHSPLKRMPETRCMSSEFVMMISGDWELLLCSFSQVMIILWQFLSTYSILRQIRVTAVLFFKTKPQTRHINNWAALRGKQIAELFITCDFLFLNIKYVSVNDTNFPRSTFRKLRMFSF